MNPTHFQDAALAAARRGWPVFPLHPNSKMPAIKQWQKRATTDETQIRQWWPRYSRKNAGVACGPAGLVVLDLDTAHDAPPEDWAALAPRHGRDVLRILAERAGEPDPIDTYTVATPGDEDDAGEHRYFQAPPGIELRNTIGANGRGLGPYLDVRAHGGNIIVAGSVRRVSGKYRLYRVTRDVPVAPLPPFLVTALTPPPPPVRVPVQLSTSAGYGAYLKTPLTAEPDRVRHAPQGERADITFKAAAKLGELVGGGYLDEAVALDVLLDAASAHNGVGGWNEAEALHHIRNGIARGRQNPRRIELAD
ncbi:bifunctional DNA primase/polymerase [Amycolatopsis sp. cmx-4-61]|uniref:bifunctional DNA primase/polymerase n=1 Tax=Amycolatopsis sp. cmx-4-61 TaxID=2790937 RepID=UPI00397AD7E8